MLAIGASTNELVLLVLALLAAGLVMGLLSGLLGIGGGGVLVPVLYETFGAIGVDPAIRMHMSVGTSLVVSASRRCARSMRPQARLRAISVC